MPRGVRRSEALRDALSPGGSSTLAGFDRPGLGFVVDLDVSPTEVTELARWQELGVRHNTELRAFRASDAGEVGRVIRDYGPTSGEVVSGGR
jgi:hypothetical protein